jgi:signal transduction histidine kinase
MDKNRRLLWRYVRGLAVPVLLWGLFVAVLIRPMQSWLHGDEEHDAATIREWIKETRIFRSALPELARDYLEEFDRPHTDPARDFRLSLKAEAIHDHLDAMGNPPKMYAGQLPDFPVIYRLALTIQPDASAEPIVIDWDSHQTRHATQYREMTYAVSPRAWIDVQYQLHAYNKQQQAERDAALRIRWMGVLAGAGTILAVLWIFLVQYDERERERQRLLAQQQVDQAEHRRLEEELLRREAERRHQETERKLLEQRIATQTAESRALELKSQLYASIGIMAGSYAHNIKNLLIRPNDLLRRCLEADGLRADQEHMIDEVRQTLGTVTERLQQILRTVRRDPSKAELAPLDLNGVVADLHRTWADLAREKWKLSLTAEPCSEPLPIEADLSHIQQAIENLIFNARDATFEMRSALRDQARRQPEQPADVRRQALIDAAAWKGSAVLRTRRQADWAVLEVQDNGIGMGEEIRKRCTQTHFSTKRDNAIYEGNSTGMGLGLSFVAVILEHHGATLEIDSAPLHGATFRVRFPFVPAAVSLSRR